MTMPACVSCAECRLERWKACLTEKTGMYGIPTKTVVTTSSCPAAVVALTLIEFNKTVISGAIVSAAAAVVVEAHIEVAGRQTVNVEHLQQQKPLCVQHT